MNAEWRSTRRRFLRATGGTLAAGLLSGCLARTAAARARPSVRFVLEWGGKGTEEGALRGPIGIAKSAADELFVTDLHNARVQRFGTDGGFRGAFALPRDMATSYGSSSSAGGIAVDGEGLVYVTLMMSHKVLVFTADGREVRGWGRRGGGEGELDEPGGIAVASNGTVFVADQRNRRVQTFTQEGRFLGAWGGYGTEPGRFDGVEPPRSRFGGPNFLALDGRGHLFTTEGTLGRVQKWTVAGQPLASFGHEGDEPGGFGALATSFSQDTFGPIGICTDLQGRVWVSSLNGRVQLFTPEGVYLAGIGRVGSGPGEFLTPHGMVVDRAGHLYVVDSGNHRVQKLAIRG